jgi:hypothetical protein
VKNGSMGAVMNNPGVARLPANLQTAALDAIPKYLDRQYASGSTEWVEAAKGMSENVIKSVVAVRNSGGDVTDVNLVEVVAGAGASMRGDHMRAATIIKNNIGMGSVMSNPGVGRLQGNLQHLALEAVPKYLDSKYTHGSTEWIDAARTMGENVIHSVVAVRSNGGDVANHQLVEFVAEGGAGGRPQNYAGATSIIKAASQIQQSLPAASIQDVTQVVSEMSSRGVNVSSANVQHVIVETVNNNQFDLSQPDARYGTVRLVSDAAAAVPADQLSYYDVTVVDRAVAATMANYNDPANKAGSTSRVNASIPSLATSNPTMFDPASGAVDQDQANRNFNLAAIAMKNTLDELAGRKRRA